MQLTGVRITDPVLQQCNIAGTLCRFLTLPKPKNTADTLLSRPDLAELPHVSISRKRVSPFDKDVKLGRWKLIEEELKKKNIPALLQFDVSKRRGPKMQ